METIQIEIQDSPDRTIVSFWGSLDVSTREYAKTALLPLVVAGQQPIVMDLSRVSYLDSTGMGVLLTVLRSIRNVQRTCSLVIGSGPLTSVLRARGIDRIVELYPSMDRALSVH